MRRKKWTDRLRTCRCLTMNRWQRWRRGTADVVIPSEPDDESSLGIVQATRKSPSHANPRVKPTTSSCARMEPPPIDLFDFAEHPQHELDRKAMLDLAQRLEGTLGDYTVKDGSQRSILVPSSPCMNSSRRRALSFARITSLSVTWRWRWKRCGSTSSRRFPAKPPSELKCPIAAAGRFT